MLLSPQIQAFPTPFQWVSTRRNEPPHERVSAHAGGFTVASEDLYQRTTAPDIQAVWNCAAGFTTRYEDENVYALSAHESIAHAPATAGVASNETVWTWRAVAEIEPVAVWNHGAGFSASSELIHFDAPAQTDGMSHHAGGFVCSHTP